MEKEVINHAEEFGGDCVKQSDNYGSADCDKTGQTVLQVQISFCTEKNITFDSTFNNSSDTSLSYAFALEKVENSGDTHEEIQLDMQDSTDKNIKKLDVKDVEEADFEVDTDESSTKKRQNTSNGGSIKKIKNCYGRAMTISRVVKTDLCWRYNMIISKAITEDDIQMLLKFLYFHSIPSMQYDHENKKNFLEGEPMEKKYLGFLNYAFDFFIKMVVCPDIQIDIIKAITTKFSNGSSCMECPHIAKATMILNVKYESIQEMFKKELQVFYNYLESKDASPSNAASHASASSKRIRSSEIKSLHNYAKKFENDSLISGDNRRQRQMQIDASPRNSAPDAVDNSITSASIAACRERFKKIDAESHFEFHQTNAQSLKQIGIEPSKCKPSKIGITRTGKIIQNEEYGCSVPEALSEVVVKKLHYLCVSKTYVDVNLRMTKQTFHIIERYDT